MIVDHNGVQRKVKADTENYKNVIFSYSDFEQYVEVFWCKEDMNMPRIDPNFYDTPVHVVQQAKIMAKLLDAAVRQAEMWMSRSPWGRSIAEDW